jgi:hypothetical protein
VSMQTIHVPSRRLHFDLCDFLQVALIVEAVSKDVAKISQCSFQRIGGSLLLGLFKGSGLALAILDLTIANILHHCQDKSHTEVEELSGTS